LEDRGLALVLPFGVYVFVTSPASLTGAFAIKASSLIAAYDTIHQTWQSLIASGQEPQESLGGWQRIGLDHHRDVLVESSQVQGVGILVGAAESQDGRIVPLGDMAELR